MVSTPPQMKTMFLKHSAHILWSHFLQQIDVIYTRKKRKLVIIFFYTETWPRMFGIFSLPYLVWPGSYLYHETVASHLTHNFLWEKKKTLLCLFWTTWCEGNSRAFDNKQNDFDRIEFKFLYNLETGFSVFMIQGLSSIIYFVDIIEKRDPKDIFISI